MERHMFKFCYGFPDLNLKSPVVHAVQSKRETADAN